MYTPDYYPNFRCIAGKCKHSCCIGWDICTDDRTAAFYLTKEDLKPHICREEDGWHIRLCQDGRCPFLNADNLCSVILKYGEQAISQICTDHPRFQNVFENHTEAGLGLCCEAVCDLILNKTEPVCFASPDLSALSDREHAFYTLRTELMNMAQDRTQPIEVRMQNILDRCHIALPERTDEQYKELFSGLERLDPAWDKKIASFKTKTVPPAFEIAAEQLLVYFLYRHTPGGLEDGMYVERIAFAVLSTRAVVAMTECDFLETARMYSAEIEYSEPNTNALLLATRK